MSKIALEGNASGTGTFTLASPNSSTDRTLTLPDASGVIDRLNRAGNVLQVVQNSSTSNYSTTSSTFQAATNHNVTITPSSTSSKILLIHQGMVNSQATNNWIYATIFRGATNLYSGGAGNAAGGQYDVASNNSILPMTFCHLDSPNTTSATTYTVHFLSGNNSSNVRYNPDGWLLYFVAMEIAG